MQSCKYFIISRLRLKSVLSALFFIKKKNIGKKKKGRYI